MKRAATKPRRNRPATAGALRLQGIACALAVVARDHAEPDIAGYALASLGLTVEDLEAAGADAHDLDPLRAL